MPDSNSNIKSMQAFLQKIDFSPVFDLTKHGTDFDYACRLLNDKKVVFEVKKETPNHTTDKIVTSQQWQLYRDFFKSDVYLVYATHNCAISDQPIPADALTVKYIELNNKPLKLEDTITLRECLEKLNGKTTPVERYYIKVKYPNGKIEYANRIVKDKKWSNPIYNAKFMNFVSINTATSYIQQRYSKPFNQSYVYEVWFIDKNGQHQKISEAKYDNAVIIQ